MLDWSAEWEQAHRRSPLRVTPLNAPGWLKFWNNDARFYLDGIKMQAALYYEVVERLTSEGWLGRDDDVLDIGAGPGTYSLPLARRARSVTALDEAEGMLRALRDDCIAQGIDNVTTVRGRWGEVDVGTEHDLALAALCPAVTSAASLLSMEQATRSKCCYVTVCPGEWMRPRNELWEMLIGKFVPSDAYSVKYPLNILLEAKRCPELFRVAAGTETRHPEQEVVDHFVRYFGIFVEMDRSKVKIVEDYVRPRAENGIVVSKGQKCLYMLCWCRPENGIS